MQKIKIISFICLVLIATNAQCIGSNQESNNPSISHDNGNQESNMAGNQAQGNPNDATHHVEVQGMSEEQTQHNIAEYNANHNANIEY